MSNGKKVCLTRCDQQMFMVAFFPWFLLNLANISKSKGNQGKQRTVNIENFVNIF